MFGKKWMAACCILAANNSVSDESYFGVTTERVGDNWVSGLNILVSPSDRADFTKLTLRASLLAGSADDRDLDAAGKEENVTYLASDVSVGLRFGHDLYAFTEAGLDFGETLGAIIMMDANIECEKEDEDNERDCPEMVDVDRHFAFGVGVTVDRLSINAYRKYRYISGFFSYF